MNPSRLLLLRRAKARGGLRERFDAWIQDVHLRDVWQTPDGTSIEVRAPVIPTGIFHGPRSS